MSMQVGVTAMLIASKYEEIWAPELRDFIYISDKAYTREQILAMEKLMLNTLNFNLTVPTAYNFLGRLLKVGQTGQICLQVSYDAISLSLTKKFSSLAVLPDHPNGSQKHILSLAVLPDHLYTKGVRPPGCLLVVAPTDPLLCLDGAGCQPC
jgi:hypothetical protein